MKNRDFFIGILITLVTLFIFEIGLRLFWQLKWPCPPECHKDIGWKYKPGKYNNGFGNFVINSLGFKGNEFTLEKPEKTFRVVCLGESTTFGPYTENAFGDYPAQLQKIINKNKIRHNGLTIQVINSGVPANTARMTLNKLNKDVLPLSPDLVILWCGWNDFCTWNPELSDKFYKDVYMTLRDYSYVIRVFGGIAHKIILPKMSDKKMLKDPNYAIKRENLYKKYVPEEFVKNVTATIRTCKENNIKVVLLDLEGLAIHKDLKEFDKRIARPHFTSDFKLYKILVRRYNKIIKEISQKENVGFLEIGEKLSTIPNMPDLYISQCHLKEEGNTIVANIVYEFLVKNKIL